MGQTYDDLLVRVDEQAPGFGGMFIDADGRLAVYLLDTSQLRATRAAIDAGLRIERPAGGLTRRAGTGLCVSAEDVDRTCRLPSWRCAA